MTGDPGAAEPTLGQQAYTAYAEHTDWRSLATGDLLPAWPDLAPPIRAAWQAAALAVVDYLNH